MNQIIQYPKTVGQYTKRYYLTIRSLWIHMKYNGKNYKIKQDHSLKSLQTLLK